MGAGFARLQRAGEDEEQDCNRNREPSQFKAVVLVKHRVAGCEIGTGVEQRQYNQDIGIPPFHRRLTYERMRRANPKLIMTSILPFGLTGPYRNYRAEDLTIWCAGGVNATTPGATAADAT